GRSEDERVPAGGRDECILHQEVLPSSAENSRPRERQPALTTSSSERCQTDALRMAQLHYDYAGLSHCHSRCGDWATNRRRRPLWRIKIHSWESPCFKAVALKLQRATVF